MDQLETMNAALERNSYVVLEPKAGALKKFHQKKIIELKNPSNFPEFMHRHNSSMEYEPLSRTACVVFILGFVFIIVTAIVVHSLLVGIILFAIYVSNVLFVCVIF